jgi:hypothetical protein
MHYLFSPIPSNPSGNSIGAIFKTDPESDLLSILSAPLGPGICDSYDTLLPGLSASALVPLHNLFSTRQLE